MSGRIGEVVRAPRPDDRESLETIRENIERDRMARFAYLAEQRRMADDAYRADDKE